MRALGLLVIVAGCGNTSEPPRQQAAPDPGPKVVAPSVSVPATPTAKPSACMHTLAIEPLASPPVVTDIEWLDDHELAVGLKDGLVIYDVAGKAAPRTYRVPVRMVRRVDATTLLVVQLDRVATFDLATGCVHESHGITIEDVAIDATHRRFFVLTPKDLVRIDAPSLDVTLTVARPLAATHLAYDAATDRVLVSSSSTSVSLLDPTSLGLATAVTVPEAPDRMWVRPGRKEAWFSYQKPCAHPKREIAKNPCLDPETAWGQTAARVELPGGRVLGTQSIRYFVGDNVRAAFSDDGRQFALSDLYRVQVQSVGGAWHELPDWPSDEQHTRPAFDPAGTRLAAAIGTSVRVVDARTGKETWSALLPTP